VIRDIERRAMQSRAVLVSGDHGDGPALDGKRGRDVSSSTPPVRLVRDFGALDGFVVEYW
jgi:hypothetical protein